MGLYLGSQKGVRVFETDQLYLVYVPCEKYFAFNFIADMVIV